MCHDGEMVLVMQAFMRFPDSTIMPRSTMMTARCMTGYNSLHLGALNKGVFGATGVSRADFQPEHSFEKSRKLTK
jgi:hypothetical protein